MAKKNIVEKHLAPGQVITPEMADRMQQRLAKIWALLPEQTRQDYCWNLANFEKRTLKQHKFTLLDKAQVLLLRHEKGQKALEQYQKSLKIIVEKVEEFKIRLYEELIVPQEKILETEQKI